MTLWKHRRECAGEEKVGILWARAKKKRVLCYVAYTDAKKKPRVTGAQGSWVRDGGCRADIRSSVFLETTCKALYPWKPKYSKVPTWESSWFWGRQACLARTDGVTGIPGVQPRLSWLCPRERRFKAASWRKWGLSWAWKNEQANQKEDKPWKRVSLLS